MGVTDVQNLKRSKGENAKLKGVIADLRLGNVLLRDLLGEISRTASKRVAVTVAIEQHGIIERRACRLAQLALDTTKKAA